MSHVLAHCARNSLHVIAIVLLLRNLTGVHCATEKFGSYMAFLRSLNSRPPTKSENSYPPFPEPANIDLGKYSKHSVLLPLVEQTISVNAKDIFEGRGLKGMSSFTVQAPIGYDGIVAVIQALKLGVGNLEVGQNSEDKGKVQNGKCRNYVKFEDGDGNESGEICGSMLSYNKEPHPQGLVGPRTFVSSTGKMVVSIEFGELPEFIQYNDQTSESAVDVEKVYELAVSFTAFRDCQPNEPRALACSFSKSGNSSCIDVDLFCDNVINCGFEENFAHDEKYCSDGVTEEIDKTDLMKQLPKSLGYWTVRPDIDYVAHIDNNNNYASLDTIMQYSLSPASTILLIVITVVCIMVLGIIIRFCCRKCVGTPLPIPNPFNSLGPASTTVLHGIERSPYQCSRRDYELDLPPSYHELFPSSKLHSSISFIEISASADDNNLPGSSDVVKIPEER